MLLNVTEMNKNCYSISYVHKYYELCHFEFISLNIKENNPYEQWLRSLAMSKVGSPDNKTTGATTLHLQHRRATVTGLR